MYKSCLEIDVYKIFWLTTKALVSEHLWEKSWHFDKRQKVEAWHAQAVSEAAADQSRSGLTLSARPRV